MSERLYVYGLVRADVDLSLNSAAIEAPGERLKVAATGPLAAIVSPIDVDEVISTRRNLLAHTKALEEAMQTTCVLPVRFGVIATDAASLGRAIASQEGRLLGLLGQMEGKSEYGVRISWTRELAMREIVAEAPHLAERQAALTAKPEAATYYERIDLGREVAERLSHKRSMEEARLFALLRRASEDSKLQGPDDDVQVLKADFLLSKWQEAELVKIVETIEAEHPGRLDVRIVGPAPTYNFVNVRLEIEPPPIAEAA